MQPLFGIMTSSFPRKVSAKTSHKPHKVWRLFHESGIQKGVQLVFFHPQDADFSRRRIYGWSCTSKDGISGWQQGWHRFPDVVFENVVLSAVGKTGALRVKGKLRGHGVQVFNPALFTKNNIFKILQSQKGMQPYLPKTRSVVQAHDVLRFLREQHLVYLKPISGSGGKGVIELRLSGDNVEVRSERFRRDRRYEASMPLSQLPLFLKPLLRQRRYVVQQGLELLMKDGRKIDFRVMVQRDETGKWRQTGIRPKLGRVNSVVTNTHSGGLRGDYQQIREWAEKMDFTLPDTDQFEKVAVLTAETFTKYRPNLSHLGIDVAVDVKGNPYVLDVNPRPGRDLLTAEMRVRYCECIVGFAAYLCEKKKHNKRVS